MEKTNQKINDGFTFVTIDSLSSEKIDTPTYSYWRSVGRKFFSNKTAIAMLVLMTAILLISRNDILQQKKKLIQQIFQQVKLKIIMVIVLEAD